MTYYYTRLERIGRHQRLLQVQPGMTGWFRGKEVSCTEFKRQLKTFMFQTDCGASCIRAFLIIAAYEYSYLLTLTYLLTLLIYILHRVINNVYLGAWQQGQ